MDTELLIFLGGQDGIGQKWGGVSIRRPKGAKSVHPPPGRFMTPFLSTAPAPISNQATAMIGLLVKSFVVVVALL